MPPFLPSFSPICFALSAGGSNCSFWAFMTPPCSLRVPASGLGIFLTNFQHYSTVFSVANQRFGPWWNQVGLGLTRVRYASASYSICPLHIPDVLSLILPRPLCTPPQLPSHRILRFPSVSLPPTVHRFFALLSSQFMRAASGDSLPCTLLYPRNSSCLFLSPRR